MDTRGRNCLLLHYTDSEQTATSINCESGTKDVLLELLNNIIIADPPTPNSPLPSNFLVLLEQTKRKHKIRNTPRNCGNKQELKGKNITSQGVIVFRVR